MNILPDFELMKDKKKIIAAGGLILNDDKDILMIFRRGFWDLPKGKLDPGETIEHCAVREVQEETGLMNIDLVQFLTITYHEYFDTYLQQDVIKESHWYLMVAPGKQSLFPQTEEDITAIKWVNTSDLTECLQNTYSNIKEVMAVFSSIQPL